VAFAAAAAGAAQSNGAIAVMATPHMATRVDPDLSIVAPLGSRDAGASNYTWAVL
jgi:hypothetical protein